VVLLVVLMVNAVAGQETAVETTEAVRIADEPLSPLIPWHTAAAAAATAAAGAVLWCCCCCCWLLLVVLLMLLLLLLLPLLLLLLDCRCWC
jgi:hypothetical protein